MVAQLLRLKLHGVVNGWRLLPGGGWRLLGAVVTVVLAVVLAARLAGLGRTDPAQLRATSVAVGTIVLLCALLLPAASARLETLSPRALVGYGIPWWRIAGAVLLTDLVAPHVLALVVLLVGYVMGWTVAGVGAVALLAAVVLLIGCVLLVRLSATLGAVVARHPLGRGLQGVLWLVAVVALAIVVVPAVGDPRYLATNIGTMAERLDRIVVGTVWDAPALHGASGSGILIVLAALGVDVLLAAVWLVVVRRELRPPRPIRERDGMESLGAFRLVGHSPVAGIAARTVTYWLRDPRYAGVLAPLPLIPVLMLIAAWIGGIPLPIMALVPLPVVTLLIGWSTVHNDVAYDSTAIWQHVVAPLSGTADRVGRLVPVLVVGAVAIAIGLPLTLWGVGTPEAWPAVVGLALATLLVGAGVSSLVSARFPYAAPEPGSSAFQAPQSAGSTGGGVQVITILVILVLASPAVAATTMWVLDGGAWAWLALLAGGAIGVIVLAAGILGGGRIVEHRGPELVAFAVRN